MSPQRGQLVLIRGRTRPPARRSRAAKLAHHGIRLVLVDPGTFWYSGLATGMLAGQYDVREDQIDPAQLVQRGGGHPVRERMIGLDASERTIALASGDTLEYDALSLDMGSEVDIRVMTCASRAPITRTVSTFLWR